MTQGKALQLFGNHADEDKNDLGTTVVTIAVTTRDHSGNHDRNHCSKDSTGAARATVTNVVTANAIAATVASQAGTAIRAMTTAATNDGYRNKPSSIHDNTTMATTAATAAGLRPQQQLIQ